MPWHVAHKVNSVWKHPQVQELSGVQVVWPLRITEETTVRCSLWMLGEKAA